MPGFPVPVGRQGPLEGVKNWGERATAPVEDIRCEKIRGCSCRGAVRPSSNVRYALIVTPLPLRSEMTRWARSRHDPAVLSPNGGKCDNLR
jgi:hypothetical protein